jgi:hypothetical protein
MSCILDEGAAMEDEVWDLVKEELCRGWYVDAVMAATRQKRIAQANARIAHVSMEGVGQHVASIDAFAFTDWGRRNPGITSDPDWLKSLLRDNPECRVAYTPQKTVITMPGNWEPERNRTDKTNGTNGLAVNTGVCP